VKTAMTVSMIFAVSDFDVEAIIFLCVLGTQIGRA